MIKLSLCEDDGGGHDIGPRKLFLNEFVGLKGSNSIAGGGQFLHFGELDLRARLVGISSNLCRGDPDAIDTTIPAANTGALLFQRFKILTQFRQVF